MATKYLAPNRNLRRSFLLLMFAWATLAAPKMIAQETSVKTKAFDVVSIHPGKPNEPVSLYTGLPDGYYRATNLPLMTTIAMAYFPLSMLTSRSTRDRIVGAPPWVMNDRYVIVAKVGPDDIEAWQKQGPGKEVQHAMLQAFLAERCKLVLHHTMVDSPAYALVVGKHGMKLKETPPEEAPPSGGVPLPEGGRLVPYRRGETPQLTFFATSMASLVARLPGLGANRPVLDKTGLTGKYDFVIPQLDTTGEPASDPDLPSPWDLDAIGLKLVPIHAPMDTLVIDHIEKPSEN